MLGDDGAADGEAEAGAAHGAGVGRVDLVEAFEDAFELVFGDAAALVADLEFGLVAVDAACAQVDLGIGRGELDGVGDEVGEGLEDAVGVGPDIDPLGVEGDAELGLGGAGLLQAGGAAEEVVGGTHGVVELGLAGAYALEFEDVVDQPDQAIGVSGGDVEHLAELFRALVEAASGDEAERGAERGERGAQLVGDGGDELVLHAVEGAALGGVGEGDDDAGCLACGLGVVRAGLKFGLDLNLGAGDVLDREAAAVLAPEDLIRDADGVEIADRLLDGTLFGRVGGAIGVAVVDEVVHVAAEDLFGFEADHLGGGRIDDGAVAIEVDAVNAVADGLQDGVGLAAECAELVLGADLLADVDAEAEDIGIAPGDFDELVAVGDDADLAVDVAEVKHSLDLALVKDFSEVIVEAGAALLGHELGEAMAGHLFAGAADRLCAVGVDGEQDALEVVGADHAERAFDELAIAGFALAQGGFGAALDGDIDTGGDDEVDVTLFVEQRRGRPCDAAQAAVAMQPLVLECGGKAVGAEALEVFDGGGDAGGGDEFVPEIAADEGGEVVAGGGLAGAVEADDAAGGVEHGDQGVDGVEHGGDEVALDDEGGLDALAGTGDAVHLAQGVAELDGGHRLPAEHGEGLHLEGSEPARGRVQHEERADADSGGRDQRGAGIEAEGAAGEEDPSGSEGRMVAGIGDFVDILGAERRGNRQSAEREFDLGDAVTAGDADAIGGGQGDSGDRGAADPGGKLGEVVNCWIGRGVEDLIAV